MLILDLIKIINKEKERYDNRSLVIYTDCKKIWNYYVKNQNKVSEYVGDAGVTLEVIKRTR